MVLELSRFLSVPLTMARAHLVTCWYRRLSGGMGREDLPDIEGGDNKLRRWDVLAPQQR